MPSTGAAIRSTAEAQRGRITAAAVRVFARTGYFATPVADVASDAGVSPAYVFRLFGSKLGLFIAATAHTYSRVADTMTQAGEQCPSPQPDDRLDAMTMAYVALIEDRNLILMQAHAQSAASVPEIRDAVQAGLGEVVRAVAVVSGAPAEAVQRFMAYGQLCHLIVQTDLGAVPASWAKSITAGIQHHP